MSNGCSAANYKSLDSGWVAADGCKLLGAPDTLRQRMTLAPELFTVGLVQLNIDGTQNLTAGASTDTYSQADITGLARVFTGWDLDLAGRLYAEATASPDVVRRPMVQVPSRYENGAKSFLGTTIDSGTSASQALTKALDAICAHPNVAPFFCRQLIQRLVTSNPSPAYVARVAGVFLRSPTVFNFFRPGYVPANTAIATAALVAEINLVLAAGQLSAATVAAVAGAVQTMPGGAAEANLRRRVQAAVLMVLAAPEYLVQK